MASEIGKSAESYGDQQDGENRDRAAAPTFFAFTKNKRKK